MRGCFEGWRIYQTIPEPDKEYPPLPAFEKWGTSEYLYECSDMGTMQTVWYVREMANVKFSSDAVPEITGTDTGKRHYAYNMGNGPVLGQLALTRGMARTYFREGTWLVGFWQNGRLFVVPLMLGYGCQRCHLLRIQKGLQWKVDVPAVDDYWVSMDARSFTLTDNEYPFWTGSLYDILGLHEEQYYVGNDVPGSVSERDLPEGYDICRAGLQEADVDYLALGDGALADYDMSPLYNGAWVDGYNRVSVYHRYRGVNRQVLVSVTVNRGVLATIYGSWIFTALYEAPNKKCFPDQETYSRTDVIATQSNGLGLTVSYQDVYDSAPDQLPTEVTVSLVE